MLLSAWGSWRSKIPVFSFDFDYGNTAANKENMMRFGIKVVEYLGKWKRARKARDKEVHHECAVYYMGAMQEYAELMQVGPEYDITFMGFREVNKYNDGELVNWGERFTAYQKVLLQLEHGGRG